MYSDPTLTAFKVRFGGMPFPPAAAVEAGALFFSYNVGNVHIIVLCPYADVSAASAQTAFLSADLAAVDRSVTPWVVVSWVRACRGARLVVLGVCPCRCGRRRAARGVRRPERPRYRSSLPAAPAMV